MDNIMNVAAIDGLRKLAWPKLDFSGLAKIFKPAAPKSVATLIDACLQPSAIGAGTESARVRDLQPVYDTLELLKDFVASPSVIKDEKAREDIEQITMQALQKILMGENIKPAYSALADNIDNMPTSVRNDRYQNSIRHALALLSHGTELRRYNGRGEFYPTESAARGYIKELAQAVSGDNQFSSGQALWFREAIVDHMSTLQSKGLEDVARDLVASAKVKSKNVVVTERFEIPRELQYERLLRMQNPHLAGIVARAMKMDIMDMDAPRLERPKKALHQDTLHS